MAEGGKRKAAGKKGQAVNLGTLGQLHVLERSFRCRIHDGALPRHRVDDDVAVDLEVVEREPVYHPCSMLSLSLSLSVVHDAKASTARHAVKICFLIGLDY